MLLPCRCFYCVPLLVLLPPQGAGMTEFMTDDDIAAWMEEEQANESGREAGGGGARSRPMPPALHDPTTHSIASGP